MERRTTSPKAKGDRYFWIESYNGGPRSFDRIGRGVGSIPNQSISMLTGIQPEPIREIAEETADDGLIQRFIPITTGPAGESSDADSTPATEAYDRLIKQLHQLPGEIIVAFTEKARAIRDTRERWHLKLMKAYETFSPKMAAHIGKYDGIFARLCLLFHCIEACEREEQVPPEMAASATAQKVADFMERFLFPHAVAFYSSVFGLASNHDQLTAVAGYILAHGKTRLTSQDIYHGDTSMRRLKRADQERVGYQLEALGWVTAVPGLRPSQSPIWVVNPEVHRRFEARAQKEAARRIEARKTLEEVTATMKYP
jgi:hypothetical protein